MTALTSPAGPSSSSLPAAAAHPTSTSPTPPAAAAPTPNGALPPTVDLASLQRLYDYSRGPAPEGDALHALVREAVGVIERALDEHGEEHVAISFNGGKDCTVLLHLLAAVLLQRHPPPSSSPSAPPPWPPIPSIYVSQPSPFPLMESFVHLSEPYYSLSLHRTSNLGMRPALASYLHLRPQIRAVMVGTRRADPHGKELDFCQPTDRGWPDFVRVHPVINWRYEQVWAFLRQWDVPYCELYDQGYTSLGSTYNTHPNPALRRPDGTFRPAYELEDEALERAGRDDSVRGPPGATEPAVAAVEDGKEGRGSRAKAAAGTVAVAAAAAAGAVGAANGYALHGKEGDGAPQQQAQGLRGAEEEEDVLL